MLVDIILVNYNGSDDTIECINSIHKTKYNYDVEIIVVDNCSNEGERKKIREFCENKGCIFIQSEVNGGFAYGNNLGIQKAIDAKADYIMLLNNDTVVQNDFLNPLVNFLQSHNDVAMVSPKILYYNHDIICSEGGEINWMLAGQNNNENKKDYKNDVEIYSSFLSGCCILFRKELIDSVGMLSEDYFMYYEDVDFSYRVCTKGYKMCCVPSSIIYHKIGMSSGGDNSPFTLEWATRGHHIFINKVAKQNGKYYFVKCYVYIRDVIRIIYYACFKSTDKAKSIWKGLVVPYRKRN